MKVVLAKHLEGVHPFVPNQDYAVRLDFLPKAALRPAEGTAQKNRPSLRFEKFDRHGRKLNSKGYIEWYLLLPYSAIMYNMSLILFSRLE